MGFGDFIAPVKGSYIEYGRRNPCFNVYILYHTSLVLLLVFVFFYVTK